MWQYVHNGSTSLAKQLIAFRTSIVRDMEAANIKALEGLYVNLSRH